MKHEVIDIMFYDRDGYHEVTQFDFNDDWNDTMAEWAHYCQEHDLELGCMSGFDVYEIDEPDWEPIDNRKLALDLGSVVNKLRRQCPIDTSDVAFEFPFDDAVGNDIALKLETALTRIIAPAFYEQAYAARSEHVKMTVELGFDIHPDSFQTLSTEYIDVTPALEIVAANRDKMPESDDIAFFEIEDEILRQASTLGLFHNRGLAWQIRETTGYDEWLKWWDYGRKLDAADAPRG